MEWEAGESNRKIDLKRTEDHFFCENSWNMDKITLNLMVPSSIGSDQLYSVIGNCRELGAWKKPVRLQRKALTPAHTELLEGKVEEIEKIKLFTTTLEIYRGKPQIHYYYVKTEAEEVAIERHPGRKFELSKDFNSHRRCVKVGHQGGDTELY